MYEAVECFVVFACTALDNQTSLDLHQFEEAFGLLALFCYLFDQPTVFEETLDFT